MKKFLMLMNLAGVIVCGYAWVEKSDSLSSFFCGVNICFFFYHLSGLKEA